LAENHISIVADIDIDKLTEPSIYSAKSTRFIVDIVCNRDINLRLLGSVVLSFKIRIQVKTWQQ